MNRSRFLYITRCGSRMEDRKDSTIYCPLNSRQSGFVLANRFRTAIHASALLIPFVLEVTSRSTVTAVLVAVTAVYVLSEALRLRAKSVPLVTRFTLQHVSARLTCERSDLLPDRVKNQLSTSNASVQRSQTANRNLARVGRSGFGPRGVRRGIFKLVETAYMKASLAQQSNSLRSETK